MPSNAAQRNVATYQCSGAPVLEMSDRIANFIEEVYADSSASASAFLEAFNCTAVDFPEDVDKVLVMQVVVLPAFVLVVELVIVTAGRPEARILVTVSESADKRERSSST